MLGPQGTPDFYDQDDAQEDLDDQQGWGGDACGRVWDYCSTGLKSPPPPCTRHPCTCPHHRHQHHLRHRHRHQYHRHPLHHCHRHSDHLNCDYSKQHIVK